MGLKVKVQTGNIASDNDIIDNCNVNVLGTQCSSGGGGHKK